MRTKCFSALLLSLLMVCSLCSCSGNDGKNPIVRPRDPSPLPDEDPPTGPPPPIPGSRKAKGEMRELDLSYLSRRGLTVDTAFICSDELLLIFASKISQGRVSERSIIYTYSITKDCFTELALPVGLVGQYPDAVLDDGRVVITLLDSEIYEPITLLLLDPETLEYEAQDISLLGDYLRSIHLSPDGKTAAVSTNMEVYICERDLSDSFARIRGYVPEGGDSSIDFHLPSVTGWLPDGSGVVCDMLGYEMVYGSLILGIDGSIRELNDYPYLSAIPCENSVFLYDSISLEPFGVYNLINNELLQAQGLRNFPNGQQSSISALDVNTSGEVIATTREWNDQRRSIEISKNGENIFSLTLTSDASMSSDIDIISLSPSGNYAVFLCAATLDSERRVFILPLGSR